MKFILKLDTPDFFKNDTKGLIKWSDYHDLDNGQSKRTLKKHLIDNEQYGICVYCECSICLESSHLEHIKPKSRYTKDTFKYQNISASCEGTTHNPENDKVDYNCGHQKENLYDENLFLSPILESDIRDYLTYDLNSCEISSSSKDKSKSEYMINTLKLNSEYLVHGRKLRLKSFKKNLKKIKNIEKRKQQALEFVAKDRGPFISLLKLYCNSVVR